MALYNNFSFKATGLSLTSDLDFINAAAGTEFQKRTGEVYVKTVDGHLEKIARTILSEAEISAKFINNTGDSTLSGSFIPSANNSASLGALNTNFNHGYFTNLHTTDIGVSGNIVLSGDAVSNIGGLTTRLNQLFATTVDSPNITTSNITVSNFVRPTGDNIGTLGSVGTAFQSAAIKTITSTTVNVGEALLPDANLGANIGSPSLKFNVVDALAFTGNAATASRTFSTQRDTNAAYYLSFVSGTASADKAFSHDDQIQVNPGTNTITCANFDGNATTATALKTLVRINGIPFNGTSSITIPANTSNNLTFTTTGLGGGAGTTFNGSAAKTISYNTVGAPSINGANAKGTWGISITGNSATSNLLQRNQNATTVIHAPDGAAYNANSNVVGAIKIRLPQTWTRTMLSMKVRIFDYAVNQTCEYLISGYTYDAGVSSGWVNCSVGTTGSNEISHTVRFGHDGTACCIFIGEINTTFSHPKVNVVDVSVGHSNYAISQWASGWTISQVQATSNVSQTITPTQRMGANYASYWGLSTPTGDSDAWIRTTANGLIPSSSNITTGISQLGTSTWPFKQTHTRALYYSGRTGYINTGNANSLRVHTGTGYIDIGPQNTTHAHIYTDRRSFAFNKRLYSTVDGWHAGTSTGLGVGTFVFLRNLKGSSVWAGSSYTGTGLHYGGTWHSNTGWYNSSQPASYTYRCMGYAQHNQMTVFQRIA